MTTRLFGRCEAEQPVDFIDHFRVDDIAEFGIIVRFVRYPAQPLLLFNRSQAGNWWFGVGVSFDRSCVGGPQSDHRTVAACSLAVDDALAAWRLPTRSLSPS